MSVLPRTDVTIRRARLMAWLRDHRDPLTAPEIARASGLYDLDLWPGAVRADRCFDDLLELKRHGRVTRTGRPAKWKAT